MDLSNGYVRVPCTIPELFCKFEIISKLSHKKNSSWEACDKLPDRSEDPGKHGRGRPPRPLSSHGSRPLPLTGWGEELPRHV